MTVGFVATSTISIQAPASHVWAVLTDRDAIKEFMFDTDVTTEWKVGGPILWRGMWKGAAYEDRGTVLECDPGRRLAVTHFISWLKTLAMARHLGDHEKRQATDHRCPEPEES